MSMSKRPVSTNPWRAARSFSSPLRQGLVILRTLAMQAEGLVPILLPSWSMPLVVINPSLLPMIG
jgi:hypothetical protein